MDDAKLLAEIDAIQPKTKAARLRALMPTIEQKLASGVAAGEILEVLNQGGLALTMGTFRNYLAQYRTRQRAPLPEKQADALAQQTGEPRPAPRAVPAPKSESYETAPPAQEPEPAALRRAPPSPLELHALMHPDPVRQAEELAHFERLSKQRGREERAARRKKPQA